MEKLSNAIVEHIRSADKPLIIGIFGHGAAGKTTFAQEILKAFDSEDRPNYINTDPYIVKSNVRNHAIIDYEFKGKSHHFKMTACHPAAHFTAALERDVRMARDGLDIYSIPDWHSESERISPQTKTTIVEGMSVAFIDPSLLDLKIYFYTDGETEFLRRSVRDIAERQRKLPDLQASHNERRTQYELFMHPYSDNFDIIIKTANQSVKIEKCNFDF